MQRFLILFFVQAKLFLVPVKSSFPPLPILVGCSPPAFPSLSFMERRSCSSLFFTSLPLASYVAINDTPNIVRRGRSDASFMERSECGHLPFSWESKEERRNFGLRRGFRLTLSQYDPFPSIMLSFPCAFVDPCRKVLLKGFDLEATFPLPGCSPQLFYQRSASILCPPFFWNGLEFSAIS